MTLAIILLIVGLVLLFCRDSPAGMVLGALALLSIGGSVAAAYMNTEYGHLFLAIALASVIGFTFWFVLIFPDNKICEKTNQPNQCWRFGIDHSKLLEQQGEAYTDLRPSGKANINDQRFDVVTEGVFLEKGDPIRVIAIEGQRVVVRKA